MCLLDLHESWSNVRIVWDMLPEGTVETGGVTAAPGVWAETGVSGLSSDGDAAVGTDGVAGSAVGPDASVKLTFG